MIGAETGRLKKYLLSKNNLILKYLNTPGSVPMQCVFPRSTDRGSGEEIPKLVENCTGKQNHA